MRALAAEAIGTFALVFFGAGDKKPAAELLPIKEPFVWKGEFPASFTVTKYENGKPAEKKITPRDCSKVT